MNTSLNPYASPEAAVRDPELDPQHDAPPSVPEVFSFEGRLGRMRLVAYLFGATMATLPLAFGALFLAGAESDVLGVALYGIVMLASAVFTTSLYVRRLHDLDKSGWLALLLLVPLVNFALIVYVFFFRGTEGSNRHGAPTVPNSGGVKAAFGLGLAFFIVVPILASIAIPAYVQYVERAEQAQMP